MKEKARTAHHLHPQGAGRTYLYKVKYDAGSAPCIDTGVLSLAICKPRIRATVQPGDWIFGFGAKSRLGERLIYIAQVTQVFPDGQYYSRKEFAGRKDRIYRWLGSRLKQLKNAVHGPADCRKDIGRPPEYSGAVVLVSRNFRYFGRVSANRFTDRTGSLMSYVSTVGQGHRVRFPERVRKELDALAGRIWTAYPRRKVIGRPTDGVGCDM